EYHVEGLPYLDEVVVHIMANAQTELTSFQAGELDMLRSVTKPAVAALEDAMPGQAVIDGPKPGYSFGSINFGNDGPWSDVRARRAVSMAIPQDDAVQVLHEGWG